MLYIFYIFFLFKCFGLIFVFILTLFLFVCFGVFCCWGPDTIATLLFITHCLTVRWSLLKSYVSIVTYTKFCLSEIQVSSAMIIM